jgi:hypothetical protein
VRLGELVGEAIILQRELLKLFSQHRLLLFKRLDLVAPAPGLIGFIKAGARQDGNDGGNHRIL